MFGWLVDFDSQQFPAFLYVYGHLELAVYLAASLLGVMIGTEQFYFLAPGLDVLGIGHGFGRRRAGLLSGARIVIFDCGLERAELGIHVPDLRVAFLVSR